MKLIIVFYLFTLSISALSQGLTENDNRIIYEIDSINSSDTSFNELLFFDTILNIPNVVFIGEQTHGEGDETIAKTRLIEYLIKKQGFNILVFESPFYDTYLGGVFVKSTKQPKVYLKTAIPPIWFSTKEFTAMKEYLISGIRTNELKIFGIDVFMGTLGRNTFIGYLEKNLINSDYTLDSTSKELLKKYIWLYDKNAKRYFTNDADSINTFYALSELLKQTKNIKSIPKGFWHQSIKNLIVQLNLNINSFYHKPYYVIDNIRDKQMADNLLWILRNKRSEDKIIVWSASMHNARNINLIEKTDDSIFYSRYKPMGGIVHDSIGNQMYSIAFTSGGGYYKTPFIMKDSVEIISEQKHSIESVFKNKKIEYGFINLKDSDTTGYFWTSLYSQPHGHNNVKAVWPLIHDGIFYIQTIHTPHIIK